MSTSPAITVNPGPAERLSAPLSREEERDLISQAQGGSRAAFDHLMNLYQNRIFRTAKRLTGNTEDARDVLQSAFMKAFINLPRFRGDSQFYTWLTTITLNEARMALRRRRAIEIPMDETQELSSRSMPWEPMDRHPDQEWSCLRGQLRELVDNHLTRMPVSLQKLIHLRYDKELSIAESAVLLGLSDTAAKSQLHRGMIQLRKSIKQQLRSARTSRQPRRWDPAMDCGAAAADGASMMRTRSRRTIQ